MIKDQTQTLSRVRNNSMAFGKLQVCAVHTAVTMLFVSTRVIKDPCYFIFKYCFGVSPQSWLYVFLLSIFPLSSFSYGTVAVVVFLCMGGEARGSQRLGMPRGCWTQGLKTGLIYCWWSLLKRQGWKKKEYAEKAGRCSDLWEEMETLGRVLINMADTNYVSCAR